jgi:hypothetical protein
VFQLPALIEASYAGCGDGFFRTMFIVAPSESLPYSTDAGPFRTSIDSTFESCDRTRFPSLRTPSTIWTTSEKPRN